MRFRLNPALVVAPRNVTGRQPLAGMLDDRLLEDDMVISDFANGGPLDAPERMPAGSVRWAGITVREPCFPYRLRDTDVRAVTTVDR